MSNETGILSNITRWEDGRGTAVSDELAIEEPLEIRVRGRPISVTMRTPGHDDELAAGFLLSEGIIGCRQDVLRIEPCTRNEFGNVIDVILAPEVFVDFKRLTRHVFASSSCGLCGKATIEAVCGAVRPLPASAQLQVSASLISSFPATMRATQETFARTGGLHAAGLFDEAGRLLACREDVGRHNAVDKIIGRMLLAGALPLSRHILLVSGRASFEIMQKSLAAGAPIVAAVSAPSTLAARFAAQSGQTLIGFLRDRRMNIYSNAGRIIFDERMGALVAESSLI